MDKLNLLLAIHCHQPVDNFGIVFSQAYEKAYLPFIEVLEQHPNIKISLHYSGALLEWLELTHPEFIKRIKSLVSRAQVEIIAGGYYEPILSLIPQNDAQGQIEMLKRSIKKLFSWQAEGYWLSERVWEPKFSLILNRAGMKWTVVDDSHFISAGLNPEDLSGYYISEEEGRPLAIFPASEKLRYLMPFKLPQETLDYLKNLYENQGLRCVCFADDGEKFGLWPGTNKWVYADKWLDNFFTALEENSSWLTVKTFDHYLNEYPPTGRIYLNCASYREMMEWSSGYFRNFLLKYEEANLMHKRMLHVSQQLSKLTDHKSSPPGGEIPSLAGQATRKKNKKLRLKEARHHLYMAQTNDAYWHGVFGGLYLSHLRSSVYSHLIEAEKLIDDAGGNKLDILDLDCDGQTELILSSGCLSCLFSPHRGGALLELDYKPKSINLINTLMRRREAYHKKIKQNLINAKDTLNQPRSIHHLKRIKQAGLEDSLIYDLFGRYCCLDHFLDKRTNLEQFFRCEYEELGDFIQGQYSLKSKNKSKNKICFKLQRSGEVLTRPIRNADSHSRIKISNRAHRVKITKGISLSNNDLSLIYIIKNESSNHLDNLFGIEFNLSVYDNQLSTTCGELKTDLLNPVRNTDSYSRNKISNGVKVNDIWNNIYLEFTVSNPSRIFHFPVETVSDSETGIEKTYQELCLFFNWQLDIAPYREWSIRLGLRIKE